MSRFAKIVVGVGVVIAAVAVAALMWWVLRDEGPAAVDLETAVGRIEAATPDDGGDSSSAEPSAAGEEAVPTTVAPTTASSAVPDTSATAEVASVTESGADLTTTSTAEETATSSGAPGPSATTSSITSTVDAPTRDTGAETTMAEVAGAAFAGVWTVVTVDGDGDLSDDPAVSFAGYRVVEVLAGGVDESTVVGRTTGVTGSIELSETALVAATVEVDMSTLRTDDSHRDSHARKSLDTKEFPQAVFALTEPLYLPVQAYEGEPFSASARGDLTIKGVTNHAVFDLQAQLVDDTIVVVGSAEVAFGDYDVTAPTSPSVISVEDHGVMEFQLYFSRSPSAGSEDE